MKDLLKYRKVTKWIQEKKYCNAGVGTAVFVLTFILFLVFTVQPPKIGLFQDPQMGSVNVSKMLV